MSGALQRVRDRAAPRSAARRWQSRRTLAVPPAGATPRRQNFALPAVSQTTGRGHDEQARPTSVVQESDHCATLVPQPLVTPAARVDPHRAVPHEVHDPQPDSTARSRRASRRGAGDRRDLRPLRGHHGRRQPVPMQDAIRRDRGAPSASGRGGASPADAERSPSATGLESGGVNPRSRRRTITWASARRPGHRHTAAGHAGSHGIPPARTVFDVRGVG